MAKTNKKIGTTPIETVKHKDKRVNIPTEELRDFVAEDEAKPKTMLYPRDPSLDPQLVWKGKDEQDAKDLAVPAVPVYIQEKIHPQAIIENVRAEAKKAKPEIQPSLFADFNGIQFEELIDFYQHEQNWANRMILGDSLLVMTSLAEKEGLKGKVQTIYIDPPYGIKFGSNWQVSTRKRDVKDSKVEDATRQPEQIKAFRDTWKLGIHSYLAYLRDRLVIARELLTETGSCFVQIGDENVHLVRCLMDEVFGSENFINIIIVIKRSPQPDDYLSSVADYLIWYGKSKDQTKFKSIYKLKDNNEEDNNDFTTSDLTSSHYYDSPDFLFEGKIYSPGKRYWSTSVNGLTKLSIASRIVVSGNTIRYKRYIKDFPFQIIGNNWPDVALSSFGDEKVYVVQTASKVIERCLLMTTDPGDLVLDPTCGSGTTAYVAEQWGRRWITIDTSRVALALARTRLMAAKYPYYYLADSPEGIKKEMEVSGKIPHSSDMAENGDRGGIYAKTEKDIKKGFVYKRVPHVTLKSIANNPDIKEGMTREQIDTAIAKHAETETLYDLPYEDPKRIRVTGPFTVESLSPHRILTVDEERPASETEARKAAVAGQFETMILDNLKKAGVQNTVKNERLKFDRLELHAGEWLHFAGEYSDKNGLTKRVAVCVGPEHGTVGHELIKEAAKEAIKGVGFDLLVICGFAFDARANETAKQFSFDETKSASKEPMVADVSKQYGKLPILLARMNPDLSMGEELLKKTGAGNLFMVFGEPDLKIKKVKGDKIIVEIKGVDVYDPTTGQIRSASTDDIACWFIDTNYNDESFFVRHAYFTGAGEPYDKLKRALRAEVDESAWAALYSTVSQPFDPPNTGKIAVKVINHYGDEVLKVYEVK